MVESDEIEYNVPCEFIKTIEQLNFETEQANSENCGPLHGKKFDLEKIKGQGRCKRSKVNFMAWCQFAYHKDHAIQISMLSLII